MMEGDEERVTSPPNFYERFLINRRKGMGVLILFFVSLIQIKGGAKIRKDKCTCGGFPLLRVV